MLKRFLLYLNSKIAQTLPAEIIQKNMAKNWKNQWTEWKPQQLFPNTLAMYAVFSAKYFEPTLLPESCIIEFGCAEAEYLLTIAPKVKKAYGFDISPAFLKTARNNAQEQEITNVTFIERDLQQWLNKPDGLPKIEKRMSRDINDDDWYISHVFFGWILMYFAKNEDVFKMFRICNRLLPSAGHILIRESLMKDRLPRKVFSAAGGYMAVYRTYEEYREMIERSGFNIVVEDAIDHEEDTRHHIFLCSKETDIA